MSRVTLAAWGGTKIANVVHHKILCLNDLLLCSLVTSWSTPFTMILFMNMDLFCSNCELSNSEGDTKIVSIYCTIMLIKIFNIVYFLPIELFLNGFEPLWGNVLIKWASTTQELIHKLTMTFDNQENQHNWGTPKRFFPASLCGKLGGALIY